MLKMAIERKRRGWSQAELGRRSGVHPTSISLIEGRRFRPGVVQLEKLRLALGVSAAEAAALLEDVSGAEAA